MPQYRVTQAFHYAQGGSVVRYTKGEQALPPAVADHALAHGFAEPMQTKPRRNPAPLATIEEKNHGTD